MSDYKLGISTVSYGKIERNETNVSYKRLEDIANVFNLPLVIIIEFDEEDIFKGLCEKENITDDIGRNRSSLLALSDVLEDISYVVSGLIKKIERLEEHEKSNNT